MDAKCILLYVTLVHLFPQAIVCQKENFTKAPVIQSFKESNSNAAEKQEPANTNGDSNEEYKVLDMYRVIPASGTILIFVGGSLSILIYEISKERRKKKQSEDMDEDEDDEMSAAWLSTVAKKSKRKNNVFAQVRRMSIAIRSGEQERDLEKERKYKIYDEMLEKYRETLRVLRRGAKPALGGDERPAARLKKLAELHNQRTTDTQASEEIRLEDASDEPVDQYAMTLQMLQPEAEITEETNENEVEEQTQNEKDENEEPDIDASYLARRRRSSRFRKQAVIEEDGSFEKPSILQRTAMYQSYMASQDNIPSTSEKPDVAGNEDDDTKIIELLEKSTSSELSALHRIQRRMRPKSLVESLAAIHRDTIGLTSPRSAASMCSLTRAGTDNYRDFELKSTPEQNSSEKTAPGQVTDSVVTKDSNDKQPNLSQSPVLRRNERTRNRPKSLYETGVTRRKVSQGKRPKARPASLYVQHRIQEAIPERQATIEDAEFVGLPLEKSASLGEKIIGSLHDLKLSSLSAAEEETVIAEIEKQLIAQVCDENDLSTDEIKALESLLEDVVTYSKEGTTGSKPKVEKQYSFTDSVSMFGDNEHGEEEDETEETVLMSLKEPSTSSSAKRLSYSKYDNA